MINDKAEEVIEEVFQSRFSRYQIGLESLMKNSWFVFDCDHLSYYKSHKINPKWEGLYIDFPNWIKSKRETINKKDNKCFQYFAIFAVIYQEIKKGLQRSLRENLLV